MNENEEAGRPHETFQRLQGDRLNRLFTRKGRTGRSFGPGSKAARALARSYRPNEPAARSKGPPNRYVHARQRAYGGSVRLDAITRGWRLVGGKVHPVLRAGYPVRPGGGGRSSSTYDKGRQG